MLQTCSLLWIGALPFAGLGQQKYFQHQSAVSGHTALQGISSVLTYYDLSPIDKLLSDSLACFHGGCTLILMQNGKVLLEKSYGSMSPDTSIPIASASKWLSAALLMTFVDEGKVSLSDSIGKYLRYLSGTKAAITIRQLFSHTSGFAAEIPIMRDTRLPMKHVVYAICQERLKYTPGTAFAYGGASMQIGGRIVEIVGGKAWEQLFQERIAQPLGMEHTTFYGAGVTPNPLVAGGAWSSARDYVRFLQMIANKGIWKGKRILSEKAIAEMMQNQAGAVPVLKQYQQSHAHYALVDKQQANYGIGVWRISAQSASLPFDMLIEVSSQGRMGFTPWYDVQRNLIGVLATYTPLKKIQATYRALKAMIRHAIPPIQQPFTIIPRTPLLSTATTLSKQSVVRKR
ncbi:MAG: serine hydrolase domain-containing protein [Bacteroidota bacterium]|nr:beta-lactamase family protein [Candidatus Kapabacteria bacterium]MDW8219915.1 serine hydrolase domain-containing protein [Bacteroidota bacterium]